MTTNPRFVARKCDATNRLVTSKDHASIQLTIPEVGADGIITGQSNSYVISGFVRRAGESDDSVNRLATRDGSLKNVWSARK